jgi:hypothetical protein
MAYALGIRLGGTNFYDGEAVQGPIFNVSGRGATISDIKSSLTRIWWVVLATVGVCLLLSLISPGGGSLSRRDVRTQPGVLTPGTGQKIARPERAEDIRSAASCLRTNRLLTTFYRPFRAGSFSVVNPGLKPRAESLSPFGTKAFEIVSELTP